MTSKNAKATDTKALDRLRTWIHGQCQEIARHAGVEEVTVSVGVDGGDMLIENVHLLDTQKESDFAALDDKLPKLLGVEEGDDLILEVHARPVYRRYLNHFATEAEHESIFSSAFGS